MDNNPWAIAPNSSDPVDVFFRKTFHYHPSVLSASLVIGAFCLLTIGSFVLTWIHGGRFMYIVPVTGCVEILGYALRIVTEQQVTLMPYVVSTLFILVAPIALALVNYIVVGKLLQVAGEPVRVLCFNLQPKRITRIFFWSDVACFFFQCSGSGLLDSGNANMALYGNATTLLGLLIQLVFFLAFIWVIHCISTDEAYGLKYINALAQVFTGLRVTVGFLLIRNLYRIAENASGMDGPVHTREWTFFIFESVPILLAFGGYCIYHFGRLLESGLKEGTPAWISDFEFLQSRAQALKSGGPVHV
jgi:hypothetical protein